MDQIQHKKETCRNKRMKMIFTVFGLVALYIGL